MRNWSPYCIEPLPAHESVLWFWLAYVHMGSYGSPAYAELDGWTRGLFETKLADNSWRIVTDRLRSEARLEGVTFSPEMLSAAAERYSHAIGPGAPLSPGDRRACILLAAELWPIVTELQTRAWIENPTPPPELVTQSRDEPGYMGRASFVMFQLLNEQILETSTPFAFTPLKVLEVKQETPRSLLAHAGNSLDPKQPKPANQFRPYRIENQKLIVTVGSVERAVDLTPRQRETLEFVIAAGEVGVALCNVAGVPASYSDFIRQIKSKLGTEELPDYIRTPGDGGKGAGGIYSIRPL